MFLMLTRRIYCRIFWAVGEYSAQKNQCSFINIPVLKGDAHRLLCQEPASERYMCVQTTNRGDEARCPVTR